MFSLDGLISLGSVGLADGHQGDPRRSASIGIGFPEEKKEHQGVPRVSMTLKNGVPDPGSWRLQVPSRKETGGLW